ncbi:MAG: hypothetical protein ACOC1K_05680 [Nanoarchaeota archaeon]
MLVKSILKDIQFFGSVKTLDYIEGIKRPLLRFKYRRAFERAFMLLKKADLKYKDKSFPMTKTEKEKEIFDE